MSKHAGGNFRKTKDLERQLAPDLLYGAGGGGRTRTLLPGLDFESSTSANSITPAKHFLYYTGFAVKKQEKI